MCKLSTVAKGQIEGAILVVAQAYLSVLTQVGFVTLDSVSGSFVVLQLHISELVCVGAEV